MDNKRHHRSHTRKYIGVVFKLGTLNYYAPFSSPKPENYNSDGTIKKSTIFSISMLENEAGAKRLLGTIKLNNMIPIPDVYVEKYDFENESDENYKNIVKSEFKWISENSSRITKNAKLLYHFKKNEFKNRTEKNGKIYDAILPFEDIEKFILDRNL